MALGYEVSKYVLDAKAGQAVIQLREAFENVEAVVAYLGNNPRPANQPDPLVALHGYTEGEAYILRSIFEDLGAKKTALQPTFDTARQITGLE